MSKPTAPETTETIVSSQAQANPTASLATTQAKPETPTISATEGQVIHDAAQERTKKALTHESDVPNADERAEFFAQAREYMAATDGQKKSELQQSLKENAKKNSFFQIFYDIAFDEAKPTEAELFAQIIQSFESFFPYEQTNNFEKLSLKISDFFNIEKSPLKEVPSFDQTKIEKAKDAYVKSLSEHNKNNLAAAFSPEDEQVSPPPPNQQRNAAPLAPVPLATTPMSEEQKKKYELARKGLMTAGQIAAVGALAATAGPLVAIAAAAALMWWYSKQTQAQTNLKAQQELKKLKALENDEVPDDLKALQNMPGFSPDMMKNAKRQAAQLEHGEEKRGNAFADDLDGEDLHEDASASPRANAGLVRELEGDLAKARALEEAAAANTRAAAQAAARSGQTSHAPTAISDVAPAAAEDLAKKDLSAHPEAVSTTQAETASPENPLSLSAALSDIAAIVVTPPAAASAQKGDEEVGPAVAAPTVTAPSTPASLPIADASSPAASESHASKVTHSRTKVSAAVQQIEQEHGKDAAAAKGRTERAGGGR